jgi:hypothetical protein
LQALDQAGVGDESAAGGDEVGKPVLEQALSNLSRLVSRLKAALTMSVPDQAWRIPAVTAAGPSSWTASVYDDVG